MVRQTVAAMLSMVLEKFVELFGDGVLSKLAKGEWPFDNIEGKSSSSDSSQNINASSVSLPPRPKSPSPSPEGEPETKPNPFVAFRPTLEAPSSDVKSPMQSKRAASTEKKRKRRRRKASSSD
eukprot:4360155-Pyramimonas_sp.AAC.1